MGKKFDLIAASKTKRYRIIMIVLIVVGLLFLGLGLLLMATITPTTLASRLDVEFSGREGANGNYTANISQNTYLNIITGTTIDQALTDPVTFTLDDNAQQFLAVANYAGTEQITAMHYAGYCQLILRNPDEIPDDIGEGTLIIQCGTRQVRITFTYVPKTENA